MLFPVKEHTKLHEGSMSSRHFICEQLLYPPEASGGYFGLASAMPPPRVERFSALTL